MQENTLLHGRTLLFVDDEPEYGELFTDIMALEHCKVLVAYNAEQAIHLLEQHHQDICVIVSDYNMPIQNGLELLKTTLTRWPDISRIMSTAISELEVAKAAINAGQVVAYCNKPWEVSEIFDTVKNAVLIHDEFAYNHRIKKLYSDLENQEQYRDQVAFISTDHILDLSSNITSFLENVNDLEPQEYKLFFAGAFLSNHMIATHVRNVSDYLKIRNGAFKAECETVSQERFISELNLAYLPFLPAIKIKFSEEVPQSLSCDFYRTSRLIYNMINYSMVDMADDITVYVSLDHTRRQLKFDLVNLSDSFSKRLHVASYFFSRKKTDYVETRFLIGVAFELLATKLIAEQLGGHVGMVSHPSSHLWFTIAWQDKCPKD